MLFIYSFNERDSSTHDYGGNRVTNDLPDSQAWMAVVFFITIGGASWIAGRAASKSRFSRAPWRAPATSDSEKISFDRFNRQTGHRIKYAKVNADAGEEVANEDIVKGYKVDTDTFIEVTKDEFDNVAARSFRQLRQFYHGINSHEVFGTHKDFISDSR